MQNNFFEEAEYAASFIPLEEILNYSRGWSPQSPVTEKGVTKTVWSKVINSIEYQVASFRGEHDSVEYDHVLPLKGGPISLPINCLLYTSDAADE